MNEIINFNEETLMKQIDFKNEISNGKAFALAFEDNNNIVIPKIYDSITEYYPNFILMDKINGIKAQDIMEKDIDEYCISYNSLLVESLIKRGVVHGDLHLGNIFFMEDYKVGIIDFGNILFIDNSLMKKIGLFYKFLFNRQVKKLCNFFLEHTLVYNNPHEKNSNNFNNKKEYLLNEIKKLFEEGNIFSGTKPINIHIMIELNEILNTINAKIDDRFMNVILAIGPMSSVASIIKRNDKTNGIRAVFLGHIRDSVPESLKNYK
jgi:predicted unusual protein kinase regulating ubiquinone biosynthesis (AarF/ABC1/UbiB family)